MNPTDITVKILEEIRDSIRETNARVDQTNQRLDQTNQRLEETRLEMTQNFDAFAKRMVETEVRLATAITGLAGKLDDVKDLLKDRLNLADRVQRCEVDIATLKQRSGIK